MDVLRDRTHLIFELQNAIDKCVTYQLRHKYKFFIFIYITDSNRNKQQIQSNYLGTYNYRNVDLYAESTKDKSRS